CSASSMAMKSRSSSSSAIARAASAARTGLFDSDPLAERVRCLRILPQHLRIGRTGGVAFAQTGERQPKLQERVRRLGALRVGLVAIQELVRGLAVFAPRKQAFAQPVL